MMLEGRVCIVTGGTRGIGRAIVEKFHKEGAKVAFTYKTSEELAIVLAQKLGNNCFYSKVDSSDASSIKEFVSRVVEKFGRIDVLVNNAGITSDNLLIKMKFDEWMHVINTNLTGPFLFCREVLPVMVRNRGGAIINITSVAGVYGNPGQANYSASKAGLIALTKTIAKEYGRRNIRANCIAPGFIQTEMTQNLPFADQLKERIPLGRTGTAEEVANVALFLASDLSSYVTGSVIFVDGGIIM